MSASKPPLPISPRGAKSATFMQASISASDASSARKRLRKSSSDSPSNSATKEGGMYELDGRLRSVLSHRLGLPLVCAFHGQDPGKLKYLAQTSNYFPSTGTGTNGKENAYADVLKTAVKEWSTPATNQEKKEVTLTTILEEGINDGQDKCKIPLHAKKEVHLTAQDKPAGRADIVLYNEDRPSRPLILVEVGLHGDDWWKKFHQGVKYIQLMHRVTNQQTDISPLLLATMTIDDKPQRSKETTKTTGDDQSFVVKLGVFLCFWKNEDSRDDDNLRISLLWQSKTHNLEDASKAFGRLLRGVCDFSSWITKQDNDDDKNEAQYEYFSSNCCRVNDKVLRSYDTRFRGTERSPEIYLSEECVDIVGQRADTIWDLPSLDCASSCNNPDTDPFWNVSSKRSLLVIATLFRQGRHDATKPTLFLPVIDQLELLHKKGFVHGDIRGFNTVIDEKNKQGYLIDFDFGGKIDSGRLYPQGYRTSLDDGIRFIGTEKSSNKILPWHDWFALGRLIFLVHLFVVPKEGRKDDRRSKTRRKRLDSRLSTLNRRWEELDGYPTPKMLDDLKKFLNEAEGAGWTVKASKAYQRVLGRIPHPRNHADVATIPCASGSPLDKKQMISVGHVTIK